MDQDLTLPEALMLLALNDETGAKQGAFLNYAVAGAGLAELAMRERVSVEEGKKPRYAIVSPEPTGDAFLDRCLEVLEGAGGEGDAKRAINKLGSARKLLEPLLDTLVARGTLRRETRKVLFFFTVTRHPEADPRAERALKDRLEAAMFGSGEVAPREGVVIALAKATNLLRANFDRDRLKRAKDRIDAIAKGGPPVTAATVEVIKAVQAAVVVAAVMPGVVAGVTAGTS